MLIQFFAALDQHGQDHEVQILVFLEFTPKLELDFIFESQELHSNHSQEGKLFATFHQLVGLLLMFIFYTFKNSSSFIWSSSLKKTEYLCMDLHPQNEQRKYHPH